tara:strand:- start:936 stop:1136 length:201 start_codon:yes stop_codon:yes gene_type:complete
MIGAALANQLAPHGFSIALVEGQTPTDYDLSQKFDLKVCALSPKSAQIMQAVLSMGYSPRDAAMPL